MRLVFEPEVLEALLDPSKRKPEEEAARLALLKEARDLDLVIHPAPVPRGQEGQGQRGEGKTWADRAGPDAVRRAADLLEAGQVAAARALLSEALEALPASPSPDRDGRP